MLAESACIPIPSEATMLFAAFGVSEGRFSLIAITIAGVAGNLVGSWVAYAVGYYGRVELIERHASRLHLKPSHIAWADRWFSRYGEATVFFTRILSHHQDIHLASCRRGEDADRAVHAVQPAWLHPLAAAPRRCRRSGRPELDAMEGRSRLRGLRRPRRGLGGGCLSRHVSAASTSARQSSAPPSQADARRITRLVHPSSTVPKHFMTLNIVARRSRRLV